MTSQNSQASLFDDGDAEAVVERHKGNATVQPLRLTSLTGLAQHPAQSGPGTSRHAG